MKKRIKSMISLILVAVFVAGTLSACSGGNDYIDFIYPFSANVNSYDPQVAGTADEFLIIENTFEGLIRMDDDGEIRKGVAESWKISDDGLTYTFHLKKGLKWNIDTEKYEEGENKGKFKDERLEMLGYEFNPDITAHDFVFALQRAVSPETQCPLFSTVAAIKNANQIYSGKMSRDKLGVTATDDYTLVINLAYPDSSFMETLTSAVAMPCNEEFFNATKGRYGLLTKYTLFNGQFYLNQILEASYLLKKNELYKGEFPAEASELTLKISDENDDVVKNLLSGYYDVAFVHGSDSKKILNDDSLTIAPYNDTTWAMQFNTSSLIFSSKTLRHAFCIGLERLDNSEEAYLTDAKSLTPTACKLNASTFGTTAEQQDINKSVKLWKKGLEDYAVTDITVTVLTTPEMENALKENLQGIQRGIGTVVRNSDDDKLNFVVKVQTMSKAEIETAMIKGEYDVALYPYTATSDSAISFLRYVSSTASGFDKKKVEKALTKAEKASDSEARNAAVREAESIIIKSYALYPMIYETGYYAAAKGVSGVDFHLGTGRVSFIRATRKD